MMKNADIVRDKARAALTAEGPLDLPQLADRVAPGIDASLRDIESALRALIAKRFMAYNDQHKLVLVGDKGCGGGNGKQLDGERPQGAAA